MSKRQKWSTYSLVSRNDSAFQKQISENAIEKAYECRDPLKNWMKDINANYTRC